MIIVHSASILKLDSATLLVAIIVVIVKGTKATFSYATVESHFLRSLRTH